MILHEKTKTFIDAEHNNISFNAGTVGNGLREQDVTFEATKKLRELLSIKKDYF